MILCLKCFQTAPLGSQFCNRCGLPFGWKLCPKGHPNSLFSRGRHCIQCGGEPLTNGVFCLRFTWFFSLLTLGWVLILLRFGVGHLDIEISLAWRIAVEMVAFVFSQTPKTVMMFVREWLNMLFLILIISCFFPGGKKFRQFLWKGAKPIGKGLKLFLFWIWERIRPPKPPKKSLAPTKAKHEEHENHPQD